MCLGPGKVTGRRQLRNQACSTAKFHILAVPCFLTIKAICMAPIGTKDTF